MDESETVGNPAFDFLRSSLGLGATGMSPPLKKQRHQGTFAANKRQQQDLSSPPGEAPANTGKRDDSD